VGGAFAGTPVRDALDSALVALRAAGVPSPRLDAELLLAAAMGVDRAALHADPAREVPPEAVRPFQAMVRRRAVDREPVAYILGRRGFRHLDLAVDPRVLIPRPETEHLVEAALAALPPGARVLDVGTGSGAVALALKHERPDLDVTGADVSDDALAVARANGERLGLEVAWVRSDLLAGAPGPWDGVVANPPYVAEGAPVDVEVARHEPAVAVYGGPDGGEVIRRLVAQAAEATPWLALEVAEGQAPGVRALLERAGFADTRVHRDLAGIERVVEGRRREGPEGDRSGGAAGVEGDRSGGARP
jgi:release factor glutamine methyltransferase